MWRWREQYGGTIIDQYKRLGASCDYAEERFTLDEAYVRAVLKVFVALYEKGLIYRDNYMVNWDPGSRSAISDLEVEDREVTDTLYYVDYPLASGHGSITVATVRPETMLGDTAIAVHPDDDRYTRLVGETAILPIVGRRLRIIADEYVKPEFGTGALKITPGPRPERLRDRPQARARRADRDRRGRPDDRGRRRALRGHDGARGARGGRRRAARGGPDQPHRALHARGAVLAALGRADRAADLAAVVHEDGGAGRAGASPRSREGRVRIHPEGQRKRYLRLAGEHPAVVHLAPAVVGPPAPGLVPRRRDLRRHGPAGRPGLGARPRRPGHVVLERAVAVRDARLARRDRGAARVLSRPTCCSTARDILFLWVARMVFMGLEFAGDIPFDDVYVHSVVQAPDGRRMSKSLGTGIDPLALIDGGPRPPVFTEGGDFPAYGADAVRYGLLAMSSTQDVRFNEGTIAEGRQLANKLFNASRLVLLRVPEGVDGAGVGADAGDGRGHAGSCRACRRAKARRRRARSSAFEFHRATRALYRFVYARAVRLVPRDAQAAAVRGGQRARPPSSRCTCWPRRWRSRIR